MSSMTATFKPNINNRDKLILLFGMSNADLCCYFLSFGGASSSWEVQCLELYWLGNREILLMLIDGMQSGSFSYFPCFVEFNFRMSTREIER